MKKLIISILSFALMLSGLPSCHDHPEGHSHGTTEEHHGENSSIVSLTETQIKSIHLQLGNIEQKSLTSTVKANGFLKVPNQNRATVTSLFRGVVSQIEVIPGSSVSKGQPIVMLTNPELVPMQEEYLSLNPKIELAELEYNRQKELSSGHAGSLKNLQNADAELKTLRIRQSSLRQQLQQMGIQANNLHPENLTNQLAVRTPISGSVANVLVNMGSSVDASTLIAEVVDNSSLHLDLFVYEKDLPHIRKRQNINFVLTNQPGKSYTAEIFSIGTTFENESKAVAVHAVVKGEKQGLIDGMSVTAQISIANAQVPALPNEAFVSHDGVDYVFRKVEETNSNNDAAELVHENGEAGHGDTEAGDHKTAEMGIEFEKIPVRKGVSDLGYTELTLLKEVPAGTQFVTKGSFFLMAKMTNTGEAHEH